MLCISLRTMNCFHFITCLTSLVLFLHINKISFMNAPEPNDT